MDFDGWTQMGNPGWSYAEVLPYFMRCEGRIGAGYHFIDSCHMGPASDRLAVVDAKLRVHGIEGLRIADASVMPTMPSGNTNAPTLMIGEKAADMIRDQAPLTPARF